MLACGKRLPPPATPSFKVENTREKIMGQDFHPISEMRKILN
jgi:hypothetical protein